MTADHRPVRVEAVGPVTASTIAWRYKGRLHVTVAAKATFVMRQGAEMIAAVPEPLAHAELHHGDSPTQSVRATSDLAPYLHRADVTLIGHACAPHGRQATVMAVRLAIHRDRPLLDKTLLVHGSRRDAAPQPFERAPLVYERAIGGIGWNENPLGIGMKAGHPPDPLAATIVSPEDATLSAGFGPISRAWPSRKRLLGGMDRKALDRPIAEIPDAFDWSYFQAAPLDQRIDFLVGDEWIELEGVDPDHPRFTSRLPRARARARVLGLDPSEPRVPTALELHADKLHIDADSLQCSLVWRGVLALPREEALLAARVIVGIELSGDPIEWPTLPMPRMASPYPSMIDALTPDPSEAGWTAGTTQLSSHDIELVDDEPPADISRDETQWEVTTEQLGYKRTASPEAPQAEPAFDAKQWETTTEQLGFRKPATSASPASPRPFNETLWDTATAPIGVRMSRPKGEEAATSSEENARWGTPTAPLLPDDLMALRARPDTPFATLLDIEPHVDPHVETNEDARRSAQAAPIPGAPWSSSAMAPTSAPTITQRTVTNARPPSSFDFDETYPPRDERRGADTAPPSTRPAMFPPPDAARASATLAAAPPTIPGWSGIEGAIAIANRTPLAAFTWLPWQSRPGRYARAVALKGTFVIVPGGRARLCSSADPPSVDVHAEGDARKTLLYPTDFAGFKPRADVTLKGHAHAQGGSAPTSRSIVRFRFGRPGNSFDRSMAVFGDRRRSEGVARAEPPPEPRPFQAIPLVYERAYGGPGFDENPAGIGHSGAALPNLEDPAHLLSSSSSSPPPPACFGAVPPLWEARSSKLGPYDAPADTALWPAPVPRDFDWTFFQSAPLAQQLDHLRGDEPFELAGVHPDHAIIEGALPGLRPRCFAQKTEDAGGGFREIELRLDTATFDADEMKLHLVWRGLLAVRDDDASDVAEIFVLLERSDKPSAGIEEAWARYLTEKTS